MNLAKKEKEASTINDSQERLEEQRFQEQCFLMDFYDQFMTHNERKVRGYPNFTQVDTTDSVAIMLNKMLGKGVSALMDIAPSELSLLQPRIRIYKVFYSGQQKDLVELRFDDSNIENRFRGIGDLAKNNLQLGGGAGLKAFEWEDLGTNPGDSGKAFKANLDMHFQNPKDFFINRARAGQPVTSFADLIRTPPNRFKETGEQEEKYYRIMVQVGWQLPPKNVIIQANSDLYKAIESSVVTMFLTRTTHIIKYNQNGTLDVSAEYIGAIEGKLLSPETDIFYVNTALEDQVQNLNRRIDLSERVAELAAVEAVNKKGARKWWDFSATNEEIVAQEAQARLEKVKLDRDVLVKENKAQAYRALLTELENREALYYVDISRDQIELLGQARSDRQQFTREVAANLRNERNKRARERFLSSFSIEHISWKHVGINTVSGKEGFGDSVESLMTANKDEEALERGIETISKSHTRANNLRPGGGMRVNFFYLGDLIDAALKIVFRDEGKNVLDRVENDDFRFLLGPIEIVDANGNKDIRSLADVPISLNLFQAWFLKNVVRPAKSKYLLRDFLRDVCSELVLKALSPDCFGPNAKSSKNLVSFSIFSIPSGGGEPIPTGCRTMIEDISEKLTAVRSKTDPLQLKHYFMMYVSGHEPDKLQPRKFKKVDGRLVLDDVAKGIYHFNVGSNRGLVKYIEFDKTDIPYLAESRIANSEDVRKGDAFLSEPYNANMFMWGNSIFKPGMVLYINPASLGMGSSVPKNERLPIGGYYSVIRVLNKISPGVFETKLDLNYLAAGEDDKQEKPAIKKADRREEISIDSPPRRTC